MMTPDEYDPPSYGGTPTQEAHAEMTLLFGAEKPTHAWILTDFDVWEPNPFYCGPPQPHPEDDYHARSCLFLSSHSKGWTVWSFARSN